MDIEQNAQVLSPWLEAYRAKTFELYNAPREIKYGKVEDKIFNVQVYVQCHGEAVEYTFGKYHSANV